MDYQILSIVLFVILLGLSGFCIYLVINLKNKIEVMRKKQEEMLKHIAGRNGKIIELLEKSVLENVKENNELLEKINNNVNDLKIEEEIIIE